MACFPRGRHDRQAAGRPDGERAGHGAGQGDVHPPDDGARAGGPRLRRGGTRGRHLLYGVPQFRQRLILVALRDGVAFRWPESLPDQVTVWNAIGDLPSSQRRVATAEGASGWAPYGGPKTASSSGCARAWTAKTLPGCMTTSPGRSVMTTRWLSRRWTPKTLYSDLPEDMRRYRADIFDDKYKRLDENGSVPDHHRAHRQGRLLVHPPQRQPHPHGS